MINLIPNEHRENIQYGRKNAQALVWLSTVAFGVVVLLIVALVGRLTIQTARNQTLSQKTAVEKQINDSDLATVEKDYNSFVDGVASVKKVYQQQILYSRLIRKMATLLPPSARLTTISLSDKDRALNLNFDNDIDGLGPTIQINLENQGAQIAEQNRTLTENGFGIQLGGKLDDSQRPLIDTNASLKMIEYYVSVPEDKDETIQRYTTALNSGGEYAFALVERSLGDQGYLNWYQDTSHNTSEAQPQLVAYKVNKTSRSVDFTVRADTLEQARQFEQTLNSSPNSLFIETYVFEDNDYTIKNKCLDRLNAETTCRAVCPDNKECTNIDKVCSPLVAIGCQYTVRAYYDELFTSAKVDKIDESAQKNICPTSTLGFKPCTHKVTATYEPLFSKVDINRVTACLSDPATAQQSCIVEMRAEFGANAKFYLVNAGGTQ